MTISVWRNSTGYTASRGRLASTIIIHKRIIANIIIIG
jgi:hypothetical protein